MQNSGTYPLSYSLSSRIKSCARENRTPTYVTKALLVCKDPTVCLCLNAAHRPEDVVALLRGEGLPVRGKPTRACALTSFSIGLFTQRSSPVFDRLTGTLNRLGLGHKKCSLWRSPRGFSLFTFSLFHFFHFFTFSQVAMTITFLITFFTFCLLSSTNRRLLLFQRSPGRRKGATRPLKAVRVS